MWSWQPGRYLDLVRNAGGQAQPRMWGQTGAWLPGSVLSRVPQVTYRTLRPGPRAVPAGERTVASVFSRGHKVGRFCHWEDDLAFTFQRLPVDAVLSRRGQAPPPLANGLRLLPRGRQSWAAAAEPQDVLQALSGRHLPAPPPSSLRSQSPGSEASSGRCLCRLPAAGAGQGHAASRARKQSHLHLHMQTRLTGSCSGRTSFPAVCVLICFGVQTWVLPRAPWHAWGRRWQIGAVHSCGFGARPLCPRSRVCPVQTPPPREGSCLSSACARHTRPLHTGARNGSPPAASGETGWFRPSLCPVAIGSLPRQFSWWPTPGTVTAEPSLVFP